MEDQLRMTKLLLGIESEDKDELIQYCIDETTNYALSYCGIDKLPDNLCTLIPKMAVDYYRLNGFGKEDAAMIIKSETQGQRSYTAETGLSVGSFLNDYKERLDRFRCKRGRVPSEVTEYR